MPEEKRESASAAESYVLTDKEFAILPGDGLEINPDTVSLKFFKAGATVRVELNFEFLPNNKIVTANPVITLGSFAVFKVDIENFNGGEFNTILLDVETETVKLKSKKVDFAFNTKGRKKQHGSGMINH